MHRKDDDDIFWETLRNTNNAYFEAISTGGLNLKIDLGLELPPVPGVPRAGDMGQVDSATAERGPAFGDDSQIRIVPGLFNPGLHAGEGIEIGGTEGDRLLQGVAGAVDLLISSLKLLGQLPRSAAAASNLKSTLSRLAAC